MILSVLPGEINVRCDELHGDVCDIKRWRRLFAFERQLGITWIFGIKGLTTSIM